MAKPEGPQAPPIPEGAQYPPAPTARHPPQVPQTLQQPIPNMLPLNWSYFTTKSKFSRKPDEDAEAHLLTTNN